MQVVLGPRNRFYLEHTQCCYMVPRSQAQDLTPGMHTLHHAWKWDVGLGRGWERPLQGPCRVDDQDKEWDIGKMPNVSFSPGSGEEASGSGQQKPEGSSAPLAHPSFHPQADVTLLSSMS